MKISTKDVPQANSLSLVGDFLALLDSGVRDNLQLSSQMGIVPREVDYYKHAARILDFVRVKEGKVEITERGHLYLNALRPREKQALLAEAVRNATVFRELSAKHGPGQLTRQTVVDFLKGATGLTGSTVGRRADTIIAWLKTTPGPTP
jgi:hypothetical protein